MLSIEEFTGRYINELQAFLPEADLEFHEIAKVNGMKEGIVVHFENSNFAPTVYIQDVYANYRESGMSVAEMALEDAAFLKNSMKHLPQMPDLSYEGAEKNLYCIVVNTDENKDWLKDIPKISYPELGLTMVARYRVERDSYGQASFLVRDGNIFQMTNQEVMEIAYRNTLREGFKMRSIESMISVTLKEDGIPDDYFSEIKNTDSGMYVVTNPTIQNGAVGMLMPQVMNQIKKEIGDFYVLPSSIHEVIILPESIVRYMTDDPKELESMVREVNSNQLAPEERLSNHVFFYNGKMSMVKDNAPAKENGMKKPTTRTVRGR